MDLNADLGEGFGVWSAGDDEALLRIVSSANVACGFHAGDALIMRRVCDWAAQFGVAVGAQVGYRDLAGFGRRRMDIGADELEADVLYQLGALQACAHAAGSRVSYLKPHGALYNTAVHDAEQAGAIVAAARVFRPDLPILTLPGSVLARLAAEAGLPVVGEVFADRSYRPDGTLTPRAEAGSVLHDPELIARRAVRMVVAGELVATDGTTVRVTAHSICVHGDSPGAVGIARGVRAALTAAGVTIGSFAQDR